MRAAESLQVAVQPVCMRGRYWMGCAQDDDANTATHLLYFGVEVPQATTQAATAEERARLMSTDRIKTVAVVVDMQNDYDLRGECAATRCAFGAAALARGGPTRSQQL